jgi:hypothetical protein
MATTAIRLFLKKVLCITVDSGDGYRLIAGGSAIGYKSVGLPAVKGEQLRNFCLAGTLFFRCWHMACLETIRNTFFDFGNSLETPLADTDA